MGCSSALSSSSHYWPCRIRHRLGAQGPEPSIDSLDPLSGPTAGGTSVTIAGNNFRGTVAVTFGGVPVPSFTEVNDGTLTATTSARAAGVADVVVIASGGTSSNTAADDFTYIDAGVTVTEVGGSTELDESGGDQTYTVALTAAPVSKVTLTISPDAQVTADEASLTFTTADWSDAQTVTVTAVDDGVVECTQSGTIQHTASGGGYDGVPINDVVATITDNDGAFVIVSQSGGTTNVSEDGASDSYTAVLGAQPSAHHFHRVNGTSQATASPTNLSFTTANWDDPQTVTVDAVDDAVQERAHTTTLSHTAAGPGYEGLGIATVIVNITDNDTVTGQILVTHSGGTTLIGESGGSDSYNVRLSLLLNQTALFFTTSNWDDLQTVTVTAFDDQIVEGTHVFGIQHVATGGGYVGVPAATIALSITDNDLASVIIPAAGGGRLTFTPIDDTWIEQGDPNETHATTIASTWTSPPSRRGCCASTSAASAASLGATCWTWSCASMCAMDPREEVGSSAPSTTPGRRRLSSRIDGSRLAATAPPPAGNPEHP